MNLNKLFNFNFFKENIRKSKGLLAFLLSIVPIINIIIFIAVLSSGNNTLVDFNSLSIVTYIGVYIIPIALAISLFGFVFKKRSVDFVMSKPLSRHSIYLTNIIGGILTIISFMLINTLIFGLFALLFDTITIPIALLFDYFLFWTISYIFVYIVTTLTVTLAGNFITCFILIAIIICLIPFLNFVQYIFADYTGYTNFYQCTSEACKPTNYYCYNDPTCLEKLANNEYYFHFTPDHTMIYTAPLALFNEEGLIYSTYSLLKMLILSIIYGVIAYFTFKRRKMEHNETDFHSEFSHYLVKTITLIPICFIIYSVLTDITNDFIGWLISLTAIIIYYIVYDLITRKEIYKLKKSLLIAIISFGVILGLYASYEHFCDTSQTINHIDKIILNDNYNNLEITDENLINMIIKAKIDYGTDSYSYTEATFISNNKKYQFDFNMTMEIEQVILSKVNQKNQKEAQNFNYDSIDYLLYNNTKIPVTNKIKELIKDNINNITYINSQNYLYVYDYHNHDYERLVIPFTSTLSDDLYEEIISIQNNQFIKKLTKHKEINSDIYFDLSVNSTFNDEDIYVFSYVINSNIDAFINYFTNDNKIIKRSDNATISFYINEQITGTISDLDSFKKEFDTYKERLKENEEYKRLLNTYQDMSNAGVSNNEY